MWMTVLYLLYRIAGISHGQENIRAKNCATPNLATSLIRLFVEIL